MAEVLVHLYRYLRNNFIATESQYVELEKQIERFYLHCIDAGFSPEQSVILGIMNINMSIK
jgi:hypothetical protein